MKVELSPRGDEVEVVVACDAGGLGTKSYGFKLKPGRKKDLLKQFELALEELGIKD